MRSATIQIQPRGSVILPAKLRAKYGLDSGDSLTVIDLDGGILLSPQGAVVPKLASEIERLRLAAGLDIADLLTSRRVVRTRRRGSRKRS
ncbi:MAG TPA: AbrB/MazE/SpoVT family DNA-binding domain-containing protein [Candidatus Binatia bacterium]|jgi:AbrB family looped-hinge helix DNA binding protein